MSGSVAEERIRAKAEALLRRLFPSGRIIHELGCGSYGPSVIDVACVTPELVVGIEVKSERDVLHRLARQYRYGRKVTDLYALAAAPAMADKVKFLQKPHLNEMEPFVRKGVEIAGQFVSKINPQHMPELTGLPVLVETDTGFDAGYTWAADNSFLRLQPALLNPADRLEMLWADELRSIAAPCGAGRRANRHDCIRLITEMMPGKEIRRSVCAALRRRTFARADQVLAA